jgi:hypothetical protein
MIRGHLILKDLPSRYGSFYILKLKITISLQSFPTAQTSDCTISAPALVVAPPRGCRRGQWLNPNGDCVNNWILAPNTQ